MQPRPTAALIVAEAQLLFPILMEPLHAPAPMGQPQLGVERAALQAPGEVPFRVPGLARQRPLPEQPAAGAGHPPVGAMQADAAGEALGRLAVGVEDPHRAPAARGHGRRDRLRRFERGELDRMRLVARAARLVAGGVRSEATSTSVGRRTPKVLLTCTT